MARPEKLSTQQVQNHLASIQGWELIDDDRIRKQFSFTNFVTAFAFMTQCADVAEELNHHPEWSNVYNRVSIDLTTHDCQGLSELDFQFAARADVLADQT